MTIFPLQLYTVQESAKVLGVDHRWLREQFRLNTFGHLRVCGTIRLTDSDLIDIRRSHGKLLDRAIKRYKVWLDRNP